MRGGKTPQSPKGDLGVYLGVYLGVSWTKTYTKTEDMRQPPRW